MSRGKIARCGTSALPCMPFPFAEQTKNCSQVMKSYHNSTAVRFYRNLFPSAQRSSDAAVTHCSCMSPDLRINTQIPPSQDISATSAQTRLSGIRKTRSPLTVAGPCRTYTCFHLSFRQIRSHPQTRGGSDMAKEHQHVCNCHTKYNMPRHLLTRGKKVNRAFS